MRTSNAQLPPRDSFGVRRRLTVGGRPAQVMSLTALAERFPRVRRLPTGLKIVLENLLRHEDGETVSADHIAAVAERALHWGEAAEILFQPTRIVMQDYSGLVALIDIATMRDRMREAGGDPKSVNPVKPVVLIVDHSLVVNHAREKDPAEKNLADEYEQNRERYEFLKWAQGAFDNLKIVPPGNGIIHQVNLERLAEVISRDAATGFVHPETQIGTDSHTPMINGLGVLGWGVGGIEAEAAMLGEPVSMLVPDVVGVRLSGERRTGVLATDIVLSITERLRQAGVVDRFVEFFGPGLNALSVGDRATIANMAPEYGATCGLFPVDEEVLRYLAMTGRSAETIARVRDYARLSGLWNDGERDYAEMVEIDLASIGLSVAGPKRPHDRLELNAVSRTVPKAAPLGDSENLRDGDVVIAAIASCTNTSNAHSMIAAGLLARNAVARGLCVPSHVKTTLSPGSRTVARYLSDAGLLDPLEALGFNLVGFGCATCVGNSGPLNEGVEAAIKKSDRSVAAVLSGNRNFEGRIHPAVKLNYLASPPLVVAYAIAGSMTRDLDAEPLGRDAAGEPVTLHDIWPTDSEIDAMVRRYVTPEVYQAGRDIYSGGPRWDALLTARRATFAWRDGSTYVGPSPFLSMDSAGAIVDAAPLLVLGDNVTTDHISPVGPIPAEGPAADFLRARGVLHRDFNSFGARRGNAQVMTRGTFANPRLKNELVSVEGSFTLYESSIMPVFDAAENYRRDGTALVIVAGKNYGAGSARDWAAKGTLSLGVKAVIAESFERIHRANLVLMGVLPLQLIAPATKASLAIDAQSRISIALPENPAPRQLVDIAIDHPKHGRQTVQALARIDTAGEVDYFVKGGVLPAVMKKMTGAAANANSEAG